MTKENKQPAAELRKHYFLERYVVIAPKRSHSLHHKRYPKRGELKTPPLEQEPSLFEIATKNGQWQVKVVANAFPAFHQDNKKAWGRQEIVLCTPNANHTKFSQLSVPQLERVFQAYRARLEALYADPKVNYVSLFHNSGLEAGASIRQVHSQIIALNLVPPRLTAELAAVAHYRKRHGSHPLSRALTWEAQHHERIIHRGQRVTSFCPYASESPYEAWIMPNQLEKSLLELSPKQIQEVIEHLRAVTTALDAVGMSYNFYLQEYVKGHRNYWHIRVTPRPNIWAGFELSTGIPINPVAPEAAAVWYRQTWSMQHAG